MLPSERPDVSEACEALARKAFRNKLHSEANLCVGEREKACARSNSYNLWKMALPLS